ncbi:hypothetical protein R3P38DRAFT_2787956 [Favolaschia claudopus]|uniref:DUF6535 domain-containing protein n=1 Tax=Favolaschia claudopus TaxID=2862362 RepID=A0AAW0AKG5_9AGAR
MSNENLPSSSAPEYSHDTAGAKLWSVYVSEAEKYDKALVDGWKSDMEGLLIFAGLFSAILTAFLIESYKTLTPDSGDDMKALLAQISAQLSGIANGSSVDLPVPESFVPPTSSLVCNLLWFISLGLSLSCALIATLVEQWARDFKYKTEMCSAPVIRARIFSYLYYGLKRFNMHAVVDIIPLLLHASLILFFAGLIAFLVPVNTAVMISVIILLGIVVIAYTTLTVFPLFSHQSPYQTPLSTGLWRAIHLTRSIWQFTLDRSTLPDSMLDAMNKAALEETEQRVHRDYCALSWTLRSLSDDVELEPFLEGIVNALTTTGRTPYYDKPIWWLLQNQTVRQPHHTDQNVWTLRKLQNSRTRYGWTPYDEPLRLLLQSKEAQLLQRVEQFLHRCESTVLLPETQTRRQLIAWKCLWAMATLSISPKGHGRDDGLIQPGPLQLDQFHFPLLMGEYPFGGLSPIHEHQLSAYAVVRLNALLTAIYTVKTTVTLLNSKQQWSYKFKEIPHLLTKLVWYTKYIRVELDSSFEQPSHIRNLEVPQGDIVGRDRRQWLAECLEALKSLHQKLICRGHENFLEFMVYAARLKSPPYQFHRTQMLLLAWFDLGAVSSDIAARYSDAYNTIMDYQCCEHVSYQPHIDSILAALLQLLAHIQKTSPKNSVCLPSNLSFYLSKSDFDRSRSHIFQDCNKWYLCSCLATELQVRPQAPLVRCNSTIQILRAMWEVAVGMGTDHLRQTWIATAPTSLHTLVHPSVCILDALRQLADHPESISIIALIQTAILNDSSLLPAPHRMKFEAMNTVPVYPTLGKEDPLKDTEEELILSILDMCVAVLTQFIHQARILHSPPYKMKETMSILTHFIPHPQVGVSAPQQLNFAKGWKAALEDDSLQGFHAIMVEIVVTSSMLQMYWNEITPTRFRWLDDCEAAQVFIEGIDSAERREDITSTSRTRLAAIREALMAVVDTQETLLENGIAESFWNQ